MKLTKLEKNEVMKVYDAWLYSYLNGDVKTYDSYLDVDYRFIGSTDNEEFLNKKDTTNFLKATADQLAGKTEIKNSIKTVEKLDGLVFITDLFDAYFLNGKDWVYYGRFRFTSALRKNKKIGWCFVYQHFSTPDAKAQEGETLGTEQITKENQELRDAIKRRTVELEQKNWELKIEASLERVRARSLAMQSSDELIDASDTMFEELEKLSINALRIGICTIDGKTGAAEIWSRSENKKSKESKILGIVPKGTHPIFDNMVKAWKEKKSFFINTRKGKEVAVYYKKLAPHLSYPLPDSYNNEETISTFFFKEGSLNVVSLQPLMKTECVIMLRFSKVFGQIYQRFLDLQKAEAQAREARIETALERVRSRTMGMQKSEELKEVVKVIFDQLAHLGINAEHAGIVVDYEPKKDWHFWIAETQDIPAKVTVPYLDLVWDRQFTEAKKEGKHFFTTQLDFDEKNSFYKKLLPHIEGLTKKARDFYFSCPGLAASTVIQQDIGLYIENFSGTPYSGEENDILMRFAKVFQQTYTRFLDLQKAEGQAREAQIEAALERVRSRTMGMRTSEELLDVATVLFQQVKDLGVPQWNCGFNIWDIGDKEFTYYPGSPDGIISPSPCKIPLTEHPIFMQFDTSRKSGDELLVYEKKGAIQADHYRYMLSLPGVGELLQNMLDTGFELPTFQIDHLANFSYGNLIFITYEHFPEMHDVFKRFAKVFEQTYTRFLDLQKAEAQAREALIEAALERVRSRTMAMQKSEDLNEAAADMFQQIQALGMQPWGCGFNIFDKDEKAVTQYMSLADGGMSPPFRTPLTEDPLFISIYEARQQKEDLLVMESKGESLAATYRYMFSLPGSGEIFRNLQNSGFEMPKFQITHCAYFSQGYLVFITYEPVHSAHDIFIRFAKVFEQTYTRFLDLQNAEAQAREAQIETALERVRSRSMAMQKSDELFEVGEVLYRELSRLGIENLTTGYVLFDEKARIGYSHGINPADGSIRHIATGMPHDETAVMKSIVKSWKKREPLLIIELNEEETIKHQTFIAERSTNFPLTAEKLIAISPKRLKIHTLNFKQGYLLIVGGTLLTDGQQGMAVRFAKVFEQVYTRFLDLQKAEAQTREAQIETALEKVRSRSLAMHKSDELGEVITIVIEKLQELGFYVEDGVALITFTQGSKDLIEWMANPGFAAAMNIHLPYFNHPILSNLWKAKKKGEEFFVKRYNADENKSFLNHIFEFTEFKHTPKEIKQYCLAADTYATSIAFQKNTAIFINDYSGLSLSEQEIAILKRFAKVFEQTYTRFLDLQKAEAQAREAQIEAALERIRAKAMAMHTSDDLWAVTGVLRTQMALLGEKELESIIIHIYDQKQDEFEAWYSFSHPDDPDGKIIDGKAILKWDKTARAREDRKKYLDAATDYTILADQKMLKEWYDYLDEVAPLVLERDDKGAIIVPEVLHYNYSKFSGGALLLITGDKAMENSKNLLKRSAEVFNLAYTRFLDLQKAEAQAREAQIETGLERVRAQTMAMNKSDDLQSAVAVIFKELDRLDLKTLRCGIGIINGQDRTVNVWTTTASDTGEDISFSGNESMDVHPLLQGAFAGWEKQEDFYYELKGEDLMAYYKTMGGDNYKLPVAASGVNVSATDHHFYYCTFFKAGGLYFFSEAPFAQELVRIIRRFANAFSLAYKRFEDLKRSEEQAHQAKIEVALERVRARALAMQQPEELVEVAEVLRYEMGLLGVEELETCSIYINDVETKKTEVWYALKDIRSTKKKLVSDHFPLDLKDTWVGREMKKFYATAKKQVSIIMKGEARKEWINYCEEKSIPFRGYYGDVIPDRTYHLYKFTHGAIGAAAAGNISIESWELLKRTAAVFSLAYSRFQDLTKARSDLQRLKTEKQRAEDALNVLKETQAQLIQSEKMASLGELTAGIAHEIQNPLNFVNNFSEVNKELLEELDLEATKGNLAEVKHLAKDIKANEEKINHHGKRADAIVKGMLQHSRSSSGIKEPTDLNALADEYLRLAYHGLRAKDKGFNATMKTDLDPKIGKVNVVPQEMGRVILNLITNAFYAVKERSSSANSSEEDYEPTVWVSTKKNKDQITISVKDNGKGIPKAVLDKIFQPFFTTKPTGEGTGLGLSMSYDIVKAHNGELNVETKEGQGTGFTIVLPSN